MSHVYTTEFWTNEDIASSNFALALASFLMIPYTLKVEAAKGMLVKDLHFTMLAIHTLICLLYSHLAITVPFLLFMVVLAVLTITIGSFASNVMEQNKLHTEIMQIESDDRKTYKKGHKIGSADPHEHHELT